MENKSKKNGTGTAEGGETARRAGGASHRAGRVFSQSNNLTI